jgi:hypothetical protein
MRFDDRWLIGDTAASRKQPSLHVTGIDSSEIISTGTFAFFHGIESAIICKAYGFDFFSFCEDVDVASKVSFPRRFVSNHICPSLRIP